MGLCQTVDFSHCEGEERRPRAEMRGGRHSARVQAVHTALRISRQIPEDAEELVAIEPSEVRGLEGTVVPRGEVPLNSAITGSGELVRRNDPYRTRE